MTKPSNGWTSKTEELLENWSKQTTINEKEHRKRGSRSGNIYLILGILLGVMQTLSVIVLLNFLVGSGGNDSVILSAILETISLVAQVIDRFYNFGSSSERYHDAAKEFNALARLIDSTLTLSRKDRDNAREFLLSIRQQFDSIQDNSPNLPNNKVIHKLELRIYKDPEQAKGSSTNLDKSDSPEPTDSDSKSIESVKLPSLNKVKSIENDENYISHAHRHKFAERFTRSKSFTNKKGRLNRDMNDLDYQLQRMEQHGEERSTITQESSSTSTSSSTDSPV